MGSEGHCFIPSLLCLLSFFFGKRKSFEKEILIGPFGGCLRIMLLHESDDYIVQRFRQLKKINLEFVHQNFKKTTKLKGLNTTRINIISLNTKF